MNKQLKKNLNLIYLFGFMYRFHLIGGVLVPFFTVWGGMTFTQMMIVQTWFLVWSFLLEIPTGAVADHIGRKHSMYLGALIWGIGALAYTSHPSMAMFLFAEFLLGLATALYSGANEAYLFDILKQYKKENLIGKVLGRYHSIELLGMVVAAPLGSFIGAKIGLEWPFRLMIIPMLIAFVVGNLMDEPKRGKESESQRYLDIVKKGLKLFAKKRKIQWISIDLAVVMTISYIMIWLYQPLLLSLGFKLEWLGFVHSASTAAQIFILSFYNRIQKKISSEKLLAATALIPAILFIVASKTYIIPLSIFAIIFSFGIGFTRKPLVAEELNSMIPSAQRATILSAVMIITKLFRSIVGPVVGKLADWSVQGTLSIFGWLLVGYFVVRQIFLHSYYKKKQA
ncbi:MFS transporter [Patescibacteria group bacterium]